MRPQWIAWINRDTKANDTESTEYYNKKMSRCEGSEAESMECPESNKVEVEIHFEAHNCRVLCWKCNANIKEKPRKHKYN